MRARFVRFSAIGTLAAALGCGDSTGVSPSDLDGTWEATRIEFTNLTDLSEVVDVTQSGAGLTLVIRATGSIVATWRQGPETEVDTGEMFVEAGQVTVILDGDASSGTIERDGDELTISLVTGVEFDFDNNGVDEPASLVLVLVKQ